MSIKIGKTFENKAIETKTLLQISFILFNVLLKVGDYLNPGKSCLDILQRTTKPSLSSGEYWILLESKPLKVYCDMKTDGGMYTYEFLCFEI